jgi:hypothetical protein
MFKKSRSSVYNHSYNKKNKKKNYNNYNNGKDNNKYILPAGQNNLINQSTERRMNIEDEIQINLDSLSSNLEKDDIKLDFYNIGKKFIKFRSDDKDGTAVIKNIKNLPFNIEEDKASNKTNKLMNIIEETRNILGWGKKKSQLDFYKHRTFSNNIIDPNNNIRNKKKSKYFSEKNDNCNICLQEIKEKFTLTCGDFFCRECIRNMILEVSKYRLDNHISSKKSLDIIELSIKKDNIKLLSELLNDVLKIVNSKSFNINYDKTSNVKIKKMQKIR